MPKKAKKHLSGAVSIIQQKHLAHSRDKNKNVWRNIAIIKHQKGDTYD